MKLSLAYEMQRPVLDDHAVIEETIEQCVLADRMGFDYVWFVEHHFLENFSASPWPVAVRRRHNCRRLVRASSSS